MKYIIWIIASAAIFGKSVDSDKLEWLAFPSILSCFISVLMGFFSLMGILPI